MSLTRSIAHNTIIQAVGRVISTLLTLVVFFLVARHLGVADYGLLTTATAFLQVFGLVVDLGLYIYLAKRLGEPGIDAGRVASNVFTLRLVTAAIIIGLAPLLVWWLPYPREVQLSVAVLAGSFLFVTLTQALSGIFQQALRTASFVGSEILGRVLLLAATIVAIRMGAGVIGISVTVTLGAAVTFIASWMAARRLVPVRLRFDPAAWREILRATWPIALSIGFNVIYFKADTIVLSLYHPARDVGLYGAPYRFLEALISAPAMIAGLLTPLLSSAFATDRQRFGRYLQRGFELLLFIALPLTIGTQFIATGLMRLVAPEFSESGPILQVLSLVTFSIFIGYLFSNAVVVVNRQRTIVWVYGLIAALSLVLYFSLIPKYSYFGAAWSHLVVETLMALSGAWIVLRTARVKLSFGIPGRIFLAGAIMAAVMFVGRDWPWALNGAIGGVVYLAAAFGLKVFDRSVLTEIFSRRPS